MIQFQTGEHHQLPLPSYGNGQHHNFQSGISGNVMWRCISVIQQSQLSFHKSSWLCWIDSFLWKLELIMKCNKAIFPFCLPSVLFQLEICRIIKAIHDQRPCEHVFSISFLWWETGSYMDSHFTKKLFWLFHKRFLYLSIKSDPHPNSPDEAKSVKLLKIIPRIITSYLIRRFFSKVE